MKPVHRLLDSVHTIASAVEQSTRRKKRLQREHVVGVFHVVRLIINGVSIVIPKVAPLARLLNGLNEHIDKKGSAHAADSPSDLRCDSAR